MRTIELAPRPVVADGFWEMPIGTDPFTIPLNDQRDLIETALAPLASIPEVDSGGITIQWRRCTTVFASSDGSLILQRLALALPRGEVSAHVDDDLAHHGHGDDHGVHGRPYGYEALAAESLADRVRDAAGRAIERARAALAPTNAEVGRYDLVFGSEATSSSAGGLEPSIVAALSLKPGPM